MNLRRVGLVTSLLVTLVTACAHTPTKKEREAADIHYQLGAEALRNQQPADAVKEFDQALAADDKLARARLGRGLALQFLGKLPEAEADYRRAIELDPQLPDAHNALGQLLATQGRLDEAIREFDRALEDMTYRDAYLARFNKGIALYRLGKRTEGIAELRASLQLAPRYCQGHRELGLMELEEGRTREALQAFTRYTEICDRVPDAWYQLALARMRSGDPDKAREAFQKCETVAGTDPLAAECRQKAQALQ